MRRDLDIDCDPAQLVLDPPDRAQLKEIFRRFEFRNLLNRVDELDAAVPRGADEGDRRRGAVARGRARLPRRRRLRGDRRPCVPSRPGRKWYRPAPAESSRATSSCTTRRRCASTPKEDTLLAAYLIDPGRAGYELDDLAAEYGVELLPTPAAEEETTALVRRAETPRRLIGPLLERLEERGVTDLYRNDRAAADVRARGDGGRRREDRHLPHGRDHRAARRPRRGARDRRRSSSPARSS